LDIPNLVHPLKVAANGKDLEPDMEKLCMYQCVGWQTLQIRTILQNSGSIFVGAAIVVSITDAISKKLGWKMVTADTRAQELVKAINRSSPASMWMKPWVLVRNSYVMALLPLLLAWVFLEEWLVTKIDSDGFYSVDYYVTFVLLYSLSCVVLLRFWHPFECYPVVYTEGIWTRGVDEFVCLKEQHYEHTKKFKRSDSVSGFTKVKDVSDTLELLEINLYQWLHLSFHERCLLLVNYARRPSKPVYIDDAGEPTGRRLVSGNAAGEELTILADLEVKVNVLRHIDGVLCRVKKVIVVKADQTVKLVRWTTENPCVAVVEVTPCHSQDRSTNELGKDKTIVGEEIYTTTKVDTLVGSKELLVQNADFFYKGDNIQFGGKQEAGFGPEGLYQIAQIAGVASKGKIVLKSGLENLLPSGTRVCIKVEAEIDQLHLVEKATEANQWSTALKEIAKLEDKHRDLSSKVLDVQARGLSSPLLDNVVTPV